MGIFFFSPSRLSAVSHLLMCSHSHITCVGASLCSTACLPVCTRATVRLSSPGLVAGTSVARGCLWELTDCGKIARLVLYMAETWKARVAADAWSGADCKGKAALYRFPYHPWQGPARLAPSHETATLHVASDDSYACMCSTCTAVCSSLPRSRFLCTTVIKNWAPIFPTE